MDNTLTEATNMAVFCDYENIAIGAKEANLDLDIHMVLERLLDKGKIVVKKAYADWDRYKSYKREMHGAAFELIEIPHVSYSGKNSADIRLVVDALDLCYTKSHVDTFVILSGDSDFSPVVSKLRENNKVVIGVGVRNSSSDLLVENCDEFLYYDDLVKKRTGDRHSKRSPRDVGRASRESSKRPPASKRPESRSESRGETRKVESSTETSPVTATTSASPVTPLAVTASSVDSEVKESLEVRRAQGMDLVLDTVEALFEERGGNLWGSMVKQTIKRKRPNFSETFYGYRTFNDLLEDAQKQGLLDIQKDDKSGGYIVVAFGPNA